MHKGSRGVVHAGLECRAGIMSWGNARCKRHNQLEGESDRWGNRPSPGRTCSLLTALLALLLLMGVAAVKQGIAQEIIRDEQGRIIGTKYVSHAKAPYVMILPTRSITSTCEQIVRRFLRLEVNCFLVEPDRFSIGQHGVYKPDSLIAELKRCVKLLRPHTEAPIILMGEEMMASVALLTALTEFRVKGVIAVSPGEYFFDRDLVKSSGARSAVPVLALHTAEETASVREMFSHYPPNLYIDAPVLEKSGFSNLANSGRANGAAWLAIGIYYRENFE